MIQYRLATTADAYEIAHLHTTNWQENYRGVLSDQYLDKEAAKERLEIWSKRLHEMPAHQVVILAEANDELCGFACTFLANDSKWGALLDNLHVASSHQRQGIGKELMRQTAAYIRNKNMETKLYLWVLKNNNRAIAFYERIGGQNVELSNCKLPGVDNVAAYRITWQDTAELL